MARDFALYDSSPVAVNATAGSAPSIWTRLIKSFAASRQRRADSAVERYIAINGGRLTDNLERDISRKFGRMAGDGL